jgi:MFS family permease
LILSLSLWTFIDTTLADKLQDDFGLTSEIVSIVYSVQMGGFLITSLFVHKALDQYVGTLVVLIAFGFQGLATWMIGPSHVFRAILPNNLAIIISGLLLTGLAGSFTAISAYSEMHDPFIEDNPHCDREKLSDILSGLYNAGFSLGTIIGPILGSYITIWSGSFRICSDYFAFFTIGYVFALLAFVYYPFIKRETVKYR